MNCKAMALILQKCEEKVEKVLEQRQEQQIAAERQQRIDMFACAALTGILSSRVILECDEAATRAWATAEAMEAERERRMKEGKG